MKNALCTATITVVIYRADRKLFPARTAAPDILNFADLHQLSNSIADGLSLRSAVILHTNPSEKLMMNIISFVLKLTILEGFIAEIRCRNVFVFQDRRGALCPIDDQFV